VRDSILFIEEGAKASKDCHVGFQTCALTCCLWQRHFGASTSDQIPKNELSISYKILEKKQKKPFFQKIGSNTNVFNSSMTQNIIFGERGLEKIGGKRK
jgi:hypothetical protein